MLSSPLHLPLGQHTGPTALQSTWNSLSRMSSWLSTAAAGSCEHPLGAGMTARCFSFSGKYVLSCSFVLHPWARGLHILHPVAELGVCHQPAGLPGLSAWWQQGSRGPAEPLFLPGVGSPPLTAAGSHMPVSVLLKRENVHVITAWGLLMCLGKLLTPGWLLGSENQRRGLGHWA